MASPNDVFDAVIDPVLLGLAVPSASEPVPALLSLQHPLPSPNNLEPPNLHIPPATSPIPLASSLAITSKDSEAPTVPLADSLRGDDLGIPPATDEDGHLISREEYQAHLQIFKRKDRLRSACQFHGLSSPKSANLESLRLRLLNHWYPAPTGGSPTPAVSQPRGGHPRSSDMASEGRDAGGPTPTSLSFDDEDALVAQFDVAGAGAALLGYDNNGLDEDEDEDGPEPDSDEAFRRFQTKTRVDAAKRFEDTRRAGGKKTQQANIKAWTIFIDEARAKGHVRDDIVDEHALLLYVNYMADRCKRDCKGDIIPGTRVGASQIKKEFFGALRIRKVQDARDPALANTRPATTVRVYDLVKARMNEALRNARLGLIPAEDAPDIVANTFLEKVSDEQLNNIRTGFLQHREIQSAVKGYLAWTLCTASGKRGDDIRAIRLCELQPHTLSHPNKVTQIPAIVAVQSEDKTSNRGMQTAVNPRYTCWIAHQDPRQCPFGALAFFLHYLFDQYRLEDKLDIQWNFNSSWRQVHLLFGSSPNAAYNEHSLYNLYCQAFKKANFESGIKAHLPRHILGYQQERLGVESSETVRLGWAHSTYFDVYAPALPKKAILGCHGYMEHEDYAPTRCQIPVPPTFLARMCPMAEGIITSVSGGAQLRGTTNFWKTVVMLRPHLFLCAAATYQVLPDSPIFRLPALAHDDVKLWMSTEFPAQLTALEASKGDPISLERLQNTLLRQSLQQMVVTLQQQSREVAQLRTIVNRRTAVLSPPKTRVSIEGARHMAEHSHAAALDFGACGVMPTDTGTTRCDGLDPPFELEDMQTQVERMPSEFMDEFFVDTETRARQDTGTYQIGDDSFRAFVALSPSSPVMARPRTEVDLVLPPAAAFTTPGHPPRMPDFGTGSVTWDQVFRHVTKAGTAYLWKAWKPSRSLDRSSLQELWQCYNTGEIVRDAANNPTAMKPPLRLVEQRFLSSWRQGTTARKSWERFREIPEWIDHTVQSERITPEDAIARLEEMRAGKDGSTAKLGVSGLANKLAEQRKTAAAAAGSNMTVPPPSLPTSSPTSCPSTPPVLDPSSSLTAFSSPASISSALPAVASTGGKRKRAPAFGARSKKRKAGTP